MKASLGTISTSSLLGISICLVFISIPFYDYSLPSKFSILAFIVWLFQLVNPKNKTIPNKKILFPLFLFSSIFLLGVVSVIFSGDWLGGIEHIQLMAPIFVLPLIILTGHFKANLSHFLKWYSLAVTIASLSAILNAIILDFVNVGNYYYYQDFAALLNKHPIHFSLMVIIALLYYFKRCFIDKIKKPFYFLSLSILIFTIYLLSSRIGLISLIAGVTLLILYSSLSKKTKWMYLFLTFVGSIIIVFSNNLKERLITQKELSQNTLDNRIIIWKSIFEVADKNLVWGIGINDTRDDLYQTYKKNKLTIAYLEKYNAHNQFLEILLTYGIFGLSIFIFFIGWLGRIILLSKNPLYKSYFLVFILFMSVESIFERIIPIWLFYLIMPLVYKEYFLRQS